MQEEYEDMNEGSEKELQAELDKEAASKFCFHNETAWICPDCGFEVERPDEGDGRSSCKACRALVCPQEICTMCETELGEIV